MNLEISLFLVMLLIACCFYKPLLALFMLILLLQPGISGSIALVLGQKSWVTYPMVVLLGCVALCNIKKQVRSDRHVVVVLLALSGFYVVLTRLITVHSVITALFYAIFHGGLISAFCLYNWPNKSFWRVILAGFITLLLLAACSYWLTRYWPALDIFNGNRYAVSEGFEGSSTRDYYEGDLARVAEAMGSRGYGVFGNQNCWAQVSAVCMVVGLAMTLLTKKVSRNMGSILLFLSILGLLGAMSRSAMLGAMVGGSMLLAAKYLGRKLIGRAMVIVFSIIVMFAVVSYAVTRSYNDSTFQLGSEEGVEYRTDAFFGTFQRLGNYWLMGNRQDRSLCPDDPHDMIMGPIFYFGLVPALAYIFAVIGGYRATVRWVTVGGDRLGHELSLPENMLWAGHVVVPVFVTMMICGVGNGIAGGTPYREMFLMYAWIGLRHRRVTMPSPNIVRSAY